MFPTLGTRLRAEVSNRLYIVALVGGMAALAGCASSGAAKDRGASRPQPSGLIVRNNHWNSMTVYLVQGGARVRVGEVAGLSQAVFPVSRLTMLAGGSDLFPGGASARRHGVSLRTFDNPAHRDARLDDRESTGALVSERAEAALTAGCLGP